MYPARFVRDDPSVFVVGAVQDRVADPVAGAVTESVAVPEALPEAAVMVVVPAAIPVASPLDPTALLIEATPVLDELQVTEAVRSCVEPFE